mgnify:CR=1 FL=1
MSARLFIVRHGNTFAPGEAPRRVGARTDLPLVESGRVQAQAIGAAFAAQGIRPDRIVTSPLLRARETGALIGAAVGVKPDTDTPAFLDEIDHGPDENRTEDEVVARIGHHAIEAWDARGEAPSDWTVDAPGRIAAWQAFVAGLSGGTHVLVTSNGAARFAFLAFPELLGRGERPNLKLRTGAWGELAVHAGAPRFIGWDTRP